MDWVVKPIMTRRTLRETQVRARCVYCSLLSAHIDFGVQFVAYYIKDGKVVALASMGNDPIMSKTSELMRLGLMPSAAEIKGGSVSVHRINIWNVY